MAELFNIHMASDLSEFTGNSSPNGLVNWTPNGLANTDGGMSVLTNSTITGGHYYYKTISTSSTTLRTRVHFHTGTVSLPSDLYFVQFVGTGGTPLYISIGYFLTYLQIKPMIGTDGGGFSPVSFTITPGEHYLEVAITRATTSSSNNGSISVWVDGGTALGGQENSFSNNDNYDTFNGLTEVRVGILQASSSHTGTFYVDEFCARDDNTLIGSGNAIVADLSMESDLSAWTSITNDSNRLSWSSSAGLGNSAGGMSVNVTNSTAIYASKTFVSPKTDGIGVRFYFDPNSITHGSNFYICLIKDSTDDDKIGVGYTSDSNLQFMYINDAGDQFPTGTAITDAPHYVELLFVRATTNVSSDGIFKAWIDDTLVQNLTNIDNYDSFPDANKLQAGFLSSVTGVSGTFYLDQFVVRSDKKKIGRYYNNTSLRPSSDSYDGNWLNESGSNTNLYASLDETSYFDADYIRSEANPSSSPVVVKLSSGTDPSSSVDHLLSYRYKKDNSSAGSVNLLVELRQGYTNESSKGTLIASGVHNNISTITTNTITLTEAEANSITDYTNLYLRFVAG